MNPLEELERLHKEASGLPWIAEDNYDSDEKCWFILGGGLGTNQYAVAAALDGYGGADDKRTGRNARLIALSRNIVGPVIELAEAVAALRAAKSGQAGMVRDPQAFVDRLTAADNAAFAALDALLRAIESEVSR